MSNQFYSRKEQQNNNEQREKVNPKELLSFLIKEGITDSQIGVVVIHNEENRLHSMDLTEKRKTICFPKNADELAKIFEMYERGNQND